MNTLLARIYLWLDFFVQKPWRGLALLMGLQMLAFGVMGLFIHAIPHFDIVQHAYFARDGDVWLNLEHHPPLVDIIYYLLGVSEKTSFLPHYIVTQLLVIATYGAAYVMGVVLLKNKVQALAATLLLVGLSAYQEHSWVGINHNVIQYPLWALIPLLTFYATRPLNQDARQHQWWLLLGFVMGVALWTKYSIVLLLATVALWVIMDKEARAHLFTPYPYAALLIFVCIAAIPLEQAWQYSDAIEGYVQQENTEKNVWLKVLLTPKLMLLAVLLAGLVSLRTRLIYPFHDMTKRETNFLCMFALMPFVIVLAMVVVTDVKLRGGWVGAMYPLWGIVLVAVTRQAWRSYSPHVILCVAIVLLLKPFYYYSFKKGFYPRFDNSQVVAEKIVERWRQETNNAPMAYIVADIGSLGGILGLYGGKEVKLIHQYKIGGGHTGNVYPSRQYTEEFKDGQLLREGALFVFYEYRTDRLKDEVRQEIARFNLKEQELVIDEFPHVIYYAIVPPANSKKP